MKRFLSAILAVLLTLCLFSVAGCNKKPGKAKTELDYTDNDEKVQYTFWAHNWNMYAGMESDKVLKTIEEKFNVKINLAGAPEDSWETKINLLVNSGDAPDLFFYRPGTGQYRKWVTQGMVLPLDPFIEKAKATNLEALFDSNQVKNATFDDQHYFVPNIFGEMNHALYVRKDWMNKWIAARSLNITQPGTLEQFADMLKYFTEEDPDGNGRNDTFGMSASSEIDWFNDFYASFGLTPFWSKSKNGDYELTALTDGYKDFLQYFADLYKKGYIYGDFYTINDAKKMYLFTSGKAGVMLSNNGATVDHIVNQMSGSTLNGKLNSKTDYLNYIDVLNVPSAKAEGNFAGGNWFYGGFSISANAEQPMRLVKILDYLMSEEGQKLRLFGVEGVHYTQQADGTIVPNVAQREKETNRWQITDLSTGYLGGKYMLGVYFSENRFTVDDKNDLSVTYDWPIYKNSELIKKSYEMITNSNLNYTEGSYILDYTPEYYEKLTVIGDEIKSSFILMVTGQAAIKDQLASMSKRLKTVGYEDVKKEYNQRLKDYGIN